MDAAMEEEDERHRERTVRQEAVIPFASAPGTFTSTKSQWRDQQEHSLIRRTAPGEDARGPAATDGNKIRKPSFAGKPVVSKHTPFKARALSAQTRWVPKESTIEYEYKGAAPVPLAPIRIRDLLHRIDHETWIRFDDRQRDWIYATRTRPLAGQLVSPRTKVAELPGFPSPLPQGWHRSLENHKEYVAFPDRNCIEPIRLAECSSSR